MRTTSKRLKILVTLLVLAGGVAAVASGTAVDLNTAGETELVELPGIGPAMAKRIIEWRERHGPFQRVEDLMKVRGIGERSLEKLRPYVTVKKPKGR